MLVIIRFNALLAATNLSGLSVEKAKPQKRKLASSSAKEGESSAAVQTKRRRKNEDTREKRAAPDEYVQIAVVCKLFTMELLQSELW